jgi:hypothetical protein
MWWILVFRAVGMMTLIKNWLLPIPWVHGAYNNIALKGGSLTLILRSSSSMFSVKGLFFFLLRKTLGENF